MISILVAIVGFEQSNYTINETNVSQEVCVVVFSPPAYEELVFHIDLLYETRTGTAGKLQL